MVEIGPHIVPWYRIGRVCKVSVAAWTLRDGPFVWIGQGRKDPIVLFFPIQCFEALPCRSPPLQF